MIVCGSGATAVANKLMGIGALRWFHLPPGCLPVCLTGADRCDATAS